MTARDAEIPAHPCCKHCGNGCCIPGHAEPCEWCPGGVA